MLCLLSPCDLAPYVGPSVLVIDDHAAVRHGLNGLLRAALAPRDLQLAATSAEALACAAACPPDLVVLDVDLAGEDGLALLPFLVGVPRVVVVLTSHADEATRQRAHALGASALIDKHAPAAELIGALTRLLEPHRMA